MTDFIFIGGCAHSGTTLLRKILTLHSNVRHYYQGIDNEENRDSMLNSKDPEYAAVMEQFKQRKNSEVFLFKNPANLFHTDLIRKNFANSRMILMNRDGRDIVLSYHRRRKYSSFKKSIKHWIKCSCKILEVRQEPDIYYLQYENFIETPAESIKELLEFLELPQEDLTQRYLESIKPDEYKKPIIQRGNKRHRQLRNWQINQPFYNSSNWKEKMGWYKKRLFYDYATHMLDAFGYTNR